MKYSNLFGKSQRTTSQQFESRNHELLIKSGFIDQVASGIYSFLPLGIRVKMKIEQVIREEMNAIGAMEVLLPTLQPKQLWDQTNRWDSVDVLFKLKSRHGQEYGVAPTAEEVITMHAKKFINSYKDLPLAVYQISSKFRDESRAKSGILRGREFTMKDLYSFHRNEQDFLEFYQKVTDAYKKIFIRLGFNDVKITEASGGDFTKKVSHEFNVLTPAGEVDLIYCTKCTYAQNEELGQVQEGGQCPKCSSILARGKAVEIGNIFDLGTRFSKDFDLNYTDQDGSQKEILMGCYGIGVSRLVGAIVEIHNDEKGIAWPKSVAPFDVHLIGIDTKEGELASKIEATYNELIKRGLTVLWDDRADVGAGVKFADADLIGIPVRLVISKKTGDAIEFKERASQQTELLKLDDIFGRITI